MPALGNISEGVLIGEDGYLFLADGGHRVFDYATGLAQVVDKSFLNFENNIRNRARDACDRGTKYLHVIVPDKQSVSSNTSPIPITTRLGELYIERCNFPGLVLYPRQLLENSTQVAFLRTDTHLTHKASITLAIELATRLTGQEFEQIGRELNGALRTVADFSGDLGRKLPERQTEMAEVYQGRGSGFWTHNNLVDGNNGVVDIRINASPLNEERVLLFGDSFGRDIAWFLSFVFREVIFLRTPFFHRDIFMQVEPDIVVTENAERYLDYCFDDNDRPSFFMYPYLGGRQYSPSKEFAEAFSAILSGKRSPYWKFRDKIS